MQRHLLFEAENRLENILTVRVRNSSIWKTLPVSGLLTGSQQMSDELIVGCSLQARLLFIVDDSRRPGKYLFFFAPKNQSGVSHCAHGRICDTTSFCFTFEMFAVKTIPDVFCTANPRKKKKIIEILFRRFGNYRVRQLVSIGRTSWNLKYLIYKKKKNLKIIQLALLSRYCFPHHSVVMISICSNSVLLNL